MDKKLIWILIAVAVLIALSAVVFRYDQTKAPADSQQAQSPTTDTNGQQATEQTPEQQAGNGQTTGTTPKPVKNPPVSNSGIAVVNPVNGDQLVIKESNRLVWSKPAQRTGTISLLTYPAKSFVGTITPNIDATQTSFLWTTKDVSLSRTNPAKKDVTPGQYMIKITFDGPVAAVESAPFSLVYADQIQPVTYTVSIKNNQFTTATLNVRRGDSVVIVNNDTVAHKIGSSHFGSNTIDPGQSKTTKITLVNVASVNFFDETFAGVKLTVNIK